MSKIIGATTLYEGSEHKYLAGYTVKIIAVMKGAAEITDEDVDHAYLTDDVALARAGGVTTDDRVEVQPWLEKEGRFSFVSSDPLAADLACFKSLR